MTKRERNESTAKGVKQGRNDSEIIMRFRVKAVRQIRKFRIGWEENKIK